MRVLPLLVATLAAFFAFEANSRIVHPKVDWSDRPESIVDARIDRLHIVKAHRGKLYAIEDHYLYVSSDTGHTFQRRGKLPDSEGRGVAARMKELVARSATARRIRRYSGPKGVVVLSTGTILVFYDQIYRSDDSGYTFSIVGGTDSSVLPGGFPSSVGYAVGKGDTVYYGEYTTTERPHPVRVARGTDDGRSWEVAHTFPSRELFHVHSITYDPFRHRFWVAAGDEGDEPRLMYTDDHFQTIHTVGCCRQEWRLVDMIVTEEKLFWGSDDDRHNPGIYSFDVDSGMLERVADLLNPSYHAALLEDGTMAISTTYEPTSPHTRNNDAPPSTSLWTSRGGSDWTRVLTRAGDFEEYSAGMRPHIQLPTGDPLPALFATPWFTEADHFVTLRLRHDP